MVITDFARLKDAEDKRDYRPNDLVVDHLGNIYLTFTPQGKWFTSLLTASGTLLWQGPYPNGLILSPDGKTLYVSSVVSKQIWAYQIEEPGQLSSGIHIASMDDGPLRGADGMAMDRAGNVYCAGPSDIWIWSPAGELLDKIACPTKPINCLW